ncbi:MAG: undecaprenyldiphospho-muramoylpentapeptide beta-N-acetylglucosaminyltransferase [Candidatus Omnitrophota bacterium]
MRVLIVSGSSGGHIFPALALIDSLQGLVNDLLLVLPEKSKRNKIIVEADRVKYIHDVNLTLKLNTKNIKGFFVFLKGAWEALLIILEFKPDVVVGFGSLNTVAIIFWAWLFRIKTIIHEQNVIPGRANQLLAKLVDQVAVSFTQTKDYLNISSGKISLTGNLLRRDLVKLERKQALDFFKLEEGKFNILITGGSQGAIKLNSTCLEALVTFENRKDLQVVHITGAGDLSDFKASYEVSGLATRVFEFLPQMQYAYSFADLIICRAGATTVAELVKFKVPAILIPYPFAYAHQLTNAQVLENIAAAEILLDQDLAVEQLKEKLSTYLFNYQKLEKMQKAYEQINVLDATTNLTNLILTLK